jgi:structural maintenance of chromosome 4
LQYCESQREKFAELKHTLEERLTELNKSRAAEIEMKNKLEEHHNNLRCAQGRKKHWKEELKKLTLQNIR